MKGLNAWIGLVALALTSCRQPVPERVLSYRELLAELTNTASFATAPVGDSHLITSFDRAGGNDDFARMDSLREKDNRYVLADLKGPGCVKRIWMTSFKAQEWQFYFDGEKSPLLTFKGHGEDADLFGKQAPFLPPLCDKVSGGSYCYLPIPYKKSLKIVVQWDGIKPDARPYYQIHHETYGAGIGVDSFPAAIKTIDEAGLESVRSVWRALATPVGDEAVPTLTAQSQVVGAGQAVTWLAQDTPGLIQSFRVRMDRAAAATPSTRAALLRNLMLRFYWNGMDKPSVEAPLGAFFCNGLAWRRFDSLVMDNADGVFQCRFPMPFKSVKAECVNQGAVPVSIQAEADVAPWDGLGALNYFHASWAGANSAGIPFRVARAEGSGYLVGTYLDAIGVDGSWNILEGDDLISVNGESQPSFHGTGLEDYFNGAWYYSGLFDLPLHGLITKSPIRTAQYRWHLSDRISFTNGLYYAFEFGHGNAAQGYLSSVAYWYQPEPHAVGDDVMTKREKIPQPDPIAPAVIMSQLFELERIRAYEEAREACLAYLEQYPDIPWNPLLQLRELAYREKIEGYAAVSNALAEFRMKTTDPAVVDQATQLAWFHESPRNALLGIHPMGRHRVYIDGQAVGEGDDPNQLRVFPVQLEPGMHELTVELAPTKPHGQMSVYLRTHMTNIVTDGTWEYVKEKPDGWPSGSDSNRPWRPVEQFFMLPSLTYARFIPNGFIDMQSGATLVRPWPEWLEGREVGYLRKRFIIAQ